MGTGIGSRPMGRLYRRGVRAVSWASVAQTLDQLLRHHVAFSRERPKTALTSLGRGGARVTTLADQGLPDQFGNHPTDGKLAPSRQFFGSCQHAGIQIEGGSHGSAFSDVIASLCEHIKNGVSESRHFPFSCLAPGAEGPPVDILGVGVGPRFARNGERLDRAAFVYAGVLTRPPGPRGPRGGSGAIGFQPLSSQRRAPAQPRRCCLNRRGAPPPC